MEERIQKLFSGVCSRRTAEAYIAAGRVTVNGSPATLGQRADPDRDAVLLDGKPLPRRPREAVYLLLNKPRGVVSTLSDEKGRRTVADLVRGCGIRVYPVGRLDMDSEGLLLLTNDGPLARRLSHPSSGIGKTYHVTVILDAGSRTRTPADAAACLAAVRSLDGEAIQPVDVETLSAAGNKVTLSVTLREGKNRQIRRMCEECGFRVRRLRRVREHTLELGDLPPGQWRYLTDEEIDELKKA